MWINPSPNLFVVNFIQKSDYKEKILFKENSWENFNWN